MIEFNFLNFVHVAELSFTFFVFSYSIVILVRRASVIFCIFDCSFVDWRVVESNMSFAQLFTLLFVKLVFVFVMIPLGCKTSKSLIQYLQLVCLTFNLLIQLLHITILSIA